MTTITREHLELAAKAAEYTDVDFSVVDAGGYAWRVSGHLGVAWQPDTDPADTWQLAADCGLVIDNYLHRIEFFLPSGASKSINFGGTTGITAAEAAHNIKGAKG